MAVNLLRVCISKGLATNISQGIQKTNILTNILHKKRHLICRISRIKEKSEAKYLSKIRQRKSMWSGELFSSQLYLGPHVMFATIKHFFKL